MSARAVVSTSGEPTGCPRRRRPVRSRRRRSLRRRRRWSPARSPCAPSGRAGRAAFLARPRSPSRVRLRPWRPVSPMRPHGRAALHPHLPQLRGASGRLQPRRPSRRARARRRVPRAVRRGRLRVRLRALSSRCSRVLPFRGGLSPEAFYGLGRGRFCEQLRMVNQRYNSSEHAAVVDRASRAEATVRPWDVRRVPSRRSPGRRTRCCTTAHAAGHPDLLAVGEGQLRHQRRDTLVLRHSLDLAARRLADVLTGGPADRLVGRIVEAHPAPKQTCSLIAPPAPPTSIPNACLGLEQTPGCRSRAGRRARNRGRAAGRSRFPGRAAPPRRPRWRRSS